MVRDGGMHFEKMRGDEDCATRVRSFGATMPTSGIELG